MKKVTFLRAFHISPEPRLEKAAKWLKGTYTDWKIVAYGWDRENKFCKKESNGILTIERFRGFGKYGGGIKRNIIGLILFNIWMVYKMIKEKPDVIHACDLDVSLAAVLVNKVLKNKLVYDIYDFYSDNRNLGIFDKPIRKLEKYIAKKADITIICDERRMEQLGICDKNILVIYNTPEDDKSNNSNESKYLLSYVGVLIPDRKILEAIECTVNELGEKFVCAGFGILKGKIEEMVRTNHNLTFYGQVDYKTAIELEGSSDAIVAMYDPNIPNNRYAAPNKLCEAMMLGKPIITSKGTLCGDLVEKEKIGIVIDHHDKKALYEAIEYLVNNKREINMMGKRARKLYEEKYSAEIAKNVLCDAYGKMVVS